MRALSCLYCFFCSRDPVRASIHFATMSVPFSFVLVSEPFDTFCEEAPGPPELAELVAPLRVEGVHLPRRSLLGGHLLHVHEAALLDPHEQGVHGAFDDVG